MATACTVTAKLCLIVLGLIYWAAAAGLCFIGSWVFITYGHYDEITDSTLTLIPASIVLSISLLMFVIGLLGCIAACNESKCLFSVFFSLIFIVLLASLVAGIMGYFYRDKVRSAVTDGLTNALDNYNETFENNQIDYIQQELHCCGINNASDWFNSPNWEKTHNLTVPLSCCKNESHCTGVINDQIYITGCVNSLEEKFHRNLVWIAATAIGFAIIQILGMISACILVCRSRDVRYEPLASAQRNGLRV